VKNNQDNQIQNTTLCNMRFFSKQVYKFTIGSGAKPPETGEFSRSFVLQVTLQPVRLLLTVSYRKMANRMYYLLPPGALPVPAPIDCDQSNVYSSHIIFLVSKLSLVPFCSFRSSARCHPLRNKISNLPPYV